MGTGYRQCDRHGFNVCCGSGCHVCVNGHGRPARHPRGEAYGLDLHEHGIPAYPEYVITASGRPSVWCMKRKHDGLSGTREVP